MENINIFPAYIEKGWRICRPSTVQHINIWCKRINNITEANFAEYCLPVGNTLQYLSQEFETNMKNINIF